MNFTYDQAGRRTGLSDNQGGSISYTLDNNNLPTNQSVYANTTLQLAANNVFDGLGRLKEAWNNNTLEKYTYAYNYTGFKPSSVTNPRSESQNTGYDRSLVSTQNGYGNSISLTYDPNNNPTTIQANSINYNLTYNQFSEILTSSNNNTGTDTYSYDIANKRITKVDAANVTHITQYDALGRPLTVTSGSDQKAFVYDTKFVGKLTSATNGNTGVSYTYNNLGQPLTKTQTINGVSKTITYGYDSVGQLTSITYPSGLIISYTYSNGIVTEIKQNNVSLISNINYQKMTFIPLSWTWGNSLTRNKTLDTSGKITALTDGVLSQTYSLDGLFNVLNITSSGVTKNYEYDNPASPVTKYYTNLGEIRYGFDSKNARSFSVDNFNSIYSSFGYTYGTNQLSSWNDGSNYYDYSYDAKGNTTNNGKGTFTYNNQNNMNSATVSGNTYNYVYNALDERVSKSGASVNKSYIYNESQQVIGEYDSTNSIEYIYFGSIPVGVYQNGQIYYIHTDHLNTPRAITNNSQALMWKWDNTDPFGKNAPINSGIDFNLRYSGQIFDNESGLNYNYYRYYNPETGRYMQADPIGIKGGFDTYSYVGQNPINFNDPLGLETRVAIVEPNFIGIGHSGIDINGTTFSLYPVNNEKTGTNLDILFTKGRIDKESFESFINKYKSKEKIHVYKIELNKDKEKELFNYLNNLVLNNKTNYSAIPITNNNCTTFVENSLGQYWNKEYVSLPFPYLQRWRFELGTFINKTIIKEGVIYDKKN